MKKNCNGHIVSVWGYIGFFVMVAGIITCAILIFSAVEDSVSSDWQISVIMLGVVVALAAVCLIIDSLRRKFLVEKPVNEILNATEKIAGGNFDIKLKPAHAYGKYNVYDVIMENINKMAAELAKNEVLKTDFISNVSHEIKTPLTVISNYSALLQDVTLSSAEKEEYARNISAATMRLTDLVTNILKLNKLENQAIRERRSQLNLSDFIGEIILGFEDRLDKKHIELNCALDDIVTYADKTFIEIICNNLLSNAVKFTGEYGKIEVCLKDGGENIILSVKDNGCGMDESTGAHIFDKFYQGDTSHAGEGNGLGLALVKKVIDNMGGEISVESEPQVGSTFVVKWKKRDEA